MIIRTAKLVLLSALLCSAVLTASVTAVALQSTTPDILNVRYFTASRNWSTVVVGDPVEGGGTPYIENATSG